MQSEALGEKLRVNLRTALAGMILLILVSGACIFIEHIWLSGLSAGEIYRWYVVRDMVLVLLLSFFFIGYLLKVGPSIFPSDQSVYGAVGQTVSETKGQNLQYGGWFIKMRWIACAVAASLIIVTISLLRCIEEEAFGPLMFLVFCLALTNLVYTFLLRRARFQRAILEIQIYTDLLILTAMFHFSGGVENPMTFIYIFHIIIAGILLTRRKCYTIVVVATAMFGFMAFAEMVGLVHHSAFFVIPQSATERYFDPSEVFDSKAAAESEQNDSHHLAHDPVYVSSMVGFQFVLFLLTAHFATTIVARLRVEEARAKAGRQRLERVVQAAGTGLIILDRELCPVWYNDHIRMWLELPAIATDSSFQRLVEWVGGKAGPAEETLLDGQLRVVERGLTTSSGAARLFQITIAPILGDNGDVYQVVEMAHEITERRRLERELLDISSREQRRIGQDLHDSLSQQLGGISFMSQVLQQSLQAKGLPEARSAARISDLLNHTLRMGHDLANRLYPVKLETEGLLSALQELATVTENIFGISCVFGHDELELVINNDEATHLYRIAQESISNAIKHGKATRIDVNVIAKTGNTILLSIKDNGKGLPGAFVQEGGMGIHIMKHRASVIGSVLDVRKDISGGTTVSCAFKNVSQDEEEEDGKENKS